MLMALCVSLTTFTVPVKAEELENPPEESNITKPFPDDRPVITPEEYEEQNKEPEAGIVISYDEDRPDVNNWEDEDDEEEPVPPFVMPVVTGEEDWELMCDKIDDLSRAESYTDIHKFKEDLVKVYKKHWKTTQALFDEYWDEDGYYEYFDNLNDRVCDYKYGYKKTPSKKELRSILNKAEKKYKKSKKVYRKEKNAEFDLIYWCFDTFDVMTKIVKSYSSGDGQKQMTTEEIKLRKKDLKELKKLKENTVDRFAWNFWRTESQKYDKPPVDRWSKLIEEGYNPCADYMKEIRKNIKSML